MNVLDVFFLFLNRQSECHYVRVCQIRVEEIRWLAVIDRRGQPVLAARSHGYALQIRALARDCSRHRHESTKRFPANYLRKLLITKIYFTFFLC